MKTKRTTCNRDCPDACGIVATVENGRVVSLAGDPDHPVTRGFLCYRTNRFLERQYDPERLTTPLMRKGSGFEQVGWETALQAIAERMLGIRDESGPAAIMSYRCGGSLGLMRSIVSAIRRRASSQPICLNTDPSRSSGAVSRSGSYCRSRKRLVL